MTPQRLAHCPQNEQAAEEAQVVGDGTWLSTGEVAEMLECSPSYVIKLIDTGQLDARRVGNRRRVRRTVAEAYRAEHVGEAGGE